MSTPAPQKKTGRMKQFIQTYKYASQTDQRLGLWTVGAFVVGAALGALGFWALPPRDLNVFKIIVMVVGAFAIGALAAVDGLQPARREGRVPADGGQAGLRDRRAQRAQARLAHRPDGRPSTSNTTWSTG